MKTLFVVFLFALFALSLSEKKSYAGYKVLRISTNGTTYDVNDVNNLADDVLADVWSANTAEGWIDVMVSPAQASAFEKFQSQVHISDVQKSLEESEADNKKSRNVGDIFDWFPTTGEVRAWLAVEIQKHPSEATLDTIGYTYDGNEIQAIVLGRGAGKPVVYIHCTIHAREWITTTTCAWIIDSLLNEDADGKLLISVFEFVIVPIFNVDGYDYTHTNDRLWRKNRSPGSCYGTDINRNYGYGWGGAGASTNPCAETYRGTGPFSTPEAAAERDYLEPYITTGRLVAYFDIHSYGAYYMSSWGYTTNPPDDYAEMARQMTVGNNAIRLVNGRSYTTGSSGRVLYLTSGGTVDWAYGSGGLIRSYTIECFGSSFTPPATWIPTIGAEVWAGVKALVLDLGKQQNLL